MPCHSLCYTALSHFTIQGGENRSCCTSH
uniref:Uncharacterized protein n=1 Tax=Anguilla anguilla TaxID=7936 RepID=A0A0E9TU39_ANGAN